MKISPKERHWKKITISSPDECWVWGGATGPFGHAQATIDKKRYLMARVMLAWSEGIDIPDSKIFALHACDNPPCVNPMHLRWGTHRDNANDALENNFAEHKGERHHSAKLCEQDVLDIRRRFDEGEKKRALVK